MKAWSLYLYNSWQKEDDELQFSAKWYSIGLVHSKMQANFGALCSIADGSNNHTYSLDFNNEKEEGEG